MQKNKRKNILMGMLALIFFSCCYMFANQYVVVKQKKRGPSRQKLQESSCQYMSCVLQRLSGLLRHIAAVQDCCLKHVTDFIEGANDSALSSVDKEKLKKVESALADLNQYLETVDGEVAKKMTTLTALLKQETKKI